MATNDALLYFRVGRAAVTARRAAECLGKEYPARLSFEDADDKKFRDGWELSHGILCRTAHEILHGTVPSEEPNGAAPED